MPAQQRAVKFRTDAEKIGARSDERRPRVRESTHSSVETQNFDSCV